MKLLWFAAPAILLYKAWNKVEDTWHADETGVVAVILDGKSFVSVDRLRRVLYEDDISLLEGYQMQEVLDKFLVELDKEVKKHAKTL